MSLLAADGLAVFRGGRLLFEGLDLNLGAGEVLQVTGANGIGKSSLLRCLAGLLAPAAGDIRRSAALALADDRLPLDPERPLARALSFWAPHGVGQALDELGLGALGDVPVRMLSSGQRKRAALAMVRLAEAPVWLLDEPLNALDSAGAGQLERMIAGHLAWGGAVLAASHVPLGGMPWPALALGR